MDTVFLMLDGLGWRWEPGDCYVLYYRRSLISAVGLTEREHSTDAVPILSTTVQVKQHPESLKTVIRIQIRNLTLSGPHDYHSVDTKRGIKMQLDRTLLPD